MIQYAPLNEVWGDMSNTSSSKKRGKKSKSSCPPLLRDRAPTQEDEHIVEEPTCDLYKGHIDNIMDTYLDAYPFDKFERISKQDPRGSSGASRGDAMDQSVAVQGDDMESYNLTSSYHPVSGDNMGNTYYKTPETFYGYNQYYGDELETMLDVEKKRKDAEEARAREELLRANEKVGCNKNVETYQQDVTESNTNKPHTSRTGTFDLIAYFGSGILLIFMMEQFVQIGMALSRSA